MESGSMETSAQEKTRPMRVEVRDFEPKDYPRLVEISNLLYAPHRWTEAEARYEDEHFDKKYFFHRWVAEDPASREVVAAGEPNPQPRSQHPPKLWRDLAAHPAWHRRGIRQTRFEGLKP